MNFSAVAYQNLDRAKMPTRQTDRPTWLPTESSLPKAAYLPRRIYKDT
jgi:hypothetical protein